jgi:hypothetical protein
LNDICHCCFLPATENIERYQMISS